MSRFSLVKPKLGFYSTPAIVSDPINGDYIHSYSQTGIQGGHHTSVKTPGFRGVKRALLPINNFSSGFAMEAYPIVKWNTDPPDLRKLEAPISSSLLLGSINRADMFDATSGTSESAEARRRALSQINDIKLNLAVATGERAQTAKHLAKTVTRVRHLLKGFKTGDLALVNRTLFEHNAKKVTNVKRKKRLDKLPYWTAPASHDITSAWLEYKYAWVPLLSDVKGAAESLARAHLGIQKTKVRGSTKVSNTIARPFYVLNAPSASFETVYSYNVSCTITFSPLNQAVTTLSSLGLTDPVSLAWELVPFSFVVDWFLPIGNYLEALSSTRGTKFVSGSETVVFASQNRVFLNTSGCKGWRLPGRTHVFTREDNEISRTKLIAFPSIPLPTLRNPVSLSNAITSVALLNQLFRK